MLKTKTFIHFVLVSLAFVFLGGCQDITYPTVDYILTNNTDEAVTVYYARQSATGFDNLGVEQKITVIVAGQEAVISTQPSVFSDGHFSVVYQTSIHTYNPGTSANERNVSIEIADF